LRGFWVPRSAEFAKTGPSVRDGDNPPRATAPLEEYASNDDFGDDDLDDFDV